MNLIPLLSWGSVNLDWEWRDAGGLQEMDVQTRNRIGCDDNGQHCNDTSFILAQTAGLQAGNIPIAISSGLRGPNCTARPDLFGTNCTAWLMKTQYLLFKNIRYYLEKIRRNFGQDWFHHTYRLVHADDF